MFAPARDRSPADPRRSFVVASLFLIAFVSLARPARAQQAAGFAVDRFEPAAAGSELVSLESLDFEGHLRPAAGLVGSWAWKPLVVYDPQGEVAPLVRQELLQHVQGSLVLWNRARVDLSLPIPLAHSGSDVIVAGQSYGAPHGYGVGDLRLGGSVRLFGRPGSRLMAGAGARLFLPTGDTRAFTSDGSVRFWPQLMVMGRPRVQAGGESDRLTIAGRLGVHVRPENACNCDLSPGSELTAGVGAGWRFSPRWSAGPELSLATALGGRFASRAGTSVELLLAGRVVVAPRWYVSFGFAPGRSDGAGTPVARAVLGVQYVVEAPPAAIPAAPPPWTPAANEVVR
jgi:OmpA-OmpF porin, OOP family